MNLSSSAAVETALLEQRDEAKAAHHQRFFKTGPGQYGEGDRFLGLTVPQTREMSKRAAQQQIPLEEIKRLLDSPWHEVRLCALQIMVARFRKGKQELREQIIELYLSSYERINNWDLVDLSVSILGEWLLDKDRQPLYDLAQCQDMWRRRMAMVATHVFIKRGDCADALRLAEILLGDREDLMHKAVGWMLREVGKRDMEALKLFLAAHYPRIPRTSLRYAIERFPEEERQRWLRYRPQNRQ